MFAILDFFVSLFAASSAPHEPVIIILD